MTIASHDIPNNFVDLTSIQRTLDPQDDGNNHHDVTIRHQQVTSCDLAVSDEGLNCFLAFTDQQGQVRAPAADQPRQIDRRYYRAACARQLAQPEALGAMVIHPAGKHIPARTSCFPRLRHHKGECLPHIRPTASSLARRGDISPLEQVERGSLSARASGGFPRARSDLDRSPAAPSDLLAKEFRRGWAARRREHRA